MSRAAELDEDRVYRAHVAERARVEADRALLAELVPYVLERAARCLHAGCRELATWRRPAPGGAGSPREDLLCDGHKAAGCVAIPGAAVVRKCAALR